jgi:predicted transposase/invertase (TIGR01784 family)
MRYLDPKNDLTFKRIFGQNKNLTISFLNALLPFQYPEEEVQEIEYLGTELVPETPFLKNSIVDVRCKDGRGRYFIVEMQMSWTKAFEKRVIFNLAKTYSKQLQKGAYYNTLQPVYALNIINDEVFQTEKFYHHLRMGAVDSPEIYIKDLQAVFVELPKFKPQNMAEKRMAVLWLRFLQELNGEKEESEIPKEFKENEFINQALDTLRESSYNEEELLHYERYFDVAATERTLIYGLQEQLEIAEFAQQERLKAEKEAQEARAEAKKFQAEHKKAEAEAKKFEAEHKKAEAERKKSEAERKKALEEREAALAREREAILQGQAFKLRYSENLSFAQIAEQLNRPLDWVEKLFNRQ